MQCVNRLPRLAEHQNLLVVVVEYHIHLGEWLVGAGGGCIGQVLRGGYGGEVCIGLLEFLELLLGGEVVVLGGRLVGTALGDFSAPAPVHVGRDESWGLLDTL